MIKFIAVFLIHAFAFSSFASIGLITPNFNSFGIGERGSVSAGALIAKGDDASSAFYNPAGLAHIKKDNFSASSSSYILNLVSQTGADNESNLDTSASYVAGVGIVGNYRWAFSVAMPINSNNNFRQTFVSDVPASNVFDVKSINSYSSRFSGLTPGLSIAKEVSNRLRLGLSARLYLVDLSSSITATSIATGQSTGDPFQYVGTDIIKLSSNSLRLEMGGQYDVSNRMTLGLVLKTESIPLTSSGRWQFTASDRQPDNSSRYQSFDADELDFAFKLPIEIQAGVAFYGSDWDFEIDLKYSHSISNRKITSKSITNEVLTRNAAGTVTSVTSNSVEIPNYNFRSNLNFAMSFSKKMNERYLASFGLFTDVSPSSRKKVENDLFTSMNFYGFSTGLTRFNKITSITFGGQYSYGSLRQQRTNPISASYVEDIKMHVVALSLSGSVYF